MRVEVLFVTPVRVAGHRYPDIVTYDDGPLVRALLKSGKAALIDPPHLPGYNDDEFEEVNGVAAPESETPVTDEEIVLEPEPIPEPKDIAKLVSFQIKPEEIEAHEHEPNKRAPQPRTRKIARLKEID